MIYLRQLPSVSDVTWWLVTQICKRPIPRIKYQCYAETRRAAKRLANHSAKAVIRIHKARTKRDALLKAGLPANCIDYVPNRFSKAYKVKTKRKLHSPTC